MNGSLLGQFSANSTWLAMHSSLIADQLQGNCVVKLDLVIVIAVAVGVRPVGAAKAVDEVLRWRGRRHTSDETAQAAVAARGTHLQAHVLEILRTRVHNTLTEG